MNFFSHASSSFPQEQLQLHQDSEQIELALKLDENETENANSNDGSCESKGDVDETALIIDISYSDYPPSERYSNGYASHGDTEELRSQDGGLSSAGVSYDPTSIDITEDELPCNLETCLALNRAYQELINDNLLQIEEMLAKNQDNQIEARFILGGGRPKRPVTESKRKTYWTEKSYYFRGKKTNVYPPPNNDVIAKRQENEPMMLRHREKRFTAAEKKKLKEAVKQDGISRRMGPLVNRKNLLTDKIKSGVGDEDEVDVWNSEILAIGEKIQNVKHKPETELIGTVEESKKVDWMKISTMTFDGQLSVHQLKCNWLNLFHPSINKGSWTKEEDSKIFELVTKYGDTGMWEIIAKQLHTNRTVFQCISRYQQELNPDMRGDSEWSSVEDDLLVSVVDEIQGEDKIPWATVCSYLPGRTGHGCRSRYFKNHKRYNTGRWTEAEDKRLLSLISILGSSLQWHKISHFMGDRAYYQCRDRYDKHLREQKPSSRPWSYTEDKIIYQMATNPQTLGKWKYIAGKLNAEVPHPDTFRLPNQVYYRALRINSWKQYCDTLVGSHNALTLSSVTESQATKGTEVRDEWIKALLPPGVSMELAKVLFKPELEGSKEMLEKDLKLIQNDRKKGIFVPHPPCNLASISRVSAPSRQREFVTGMLQSVARRAEADRLHEHNPVDKAVNEKQELFLDENILEKYLSSHRGASMNEALKERLRNSLKDADKLRMRDVFHLCKEIRQEILTKTEEPKKQSRVRAIDHKLATMIRQRTNGDRKMARGRSKKYHLYLQPSSNHDLSRYVDKTASRKQMIHLLCQALEIDRPKLLGHQTCTYPTEKPLGLLLDDLKQIESESESENETLEPDNVASDISDLPTDSSKHTRAKKKPVRKCVMNSPSGIWGTATEFPPPDAPAPLPPNNCTLFAFRKLLLDRRNLFKSASRFINRRDTQDIWRSRAFTADPEYQKLRSRFVTMFLWPGLLSAMPVKPPDSTPACSENGEGNEGVTEGLTDEEEGGVEGVNVEVQQQQTESPKATPASKTAGKRSKSTVPSRATKKRKTNNEVPNADDDTGVQTSVPE